MAALRRLAAGSLTTFACAVALAATADAANAPVAIGDYEGAPVLDAGGTYQGAYFSVTKEAGKRTIVATEDLPGIYYPDVGECDDEMLPLSAETVAVTSAARFKIRDTTTLEGGEVLVVWKGRWTKAKRVKGTITIRSGDCASKERWSGSRVG